MDGGLGFFYKHEGWRKVLVADIENIRGGKQGQGRQKREYNNHDLREC